MTLIWGLAACFVFLRFRNIFPLGMAHAIFGICVAITFPGPVVHNMRVGLGYLRYRAPLRVHRNQSDHKVSTVGMGHGRCADAAISAPRPAIEDSGQRGQQNILPVEARGPLIPVREAEK